MDRKQAYSLAAAITGLDRYDASKILENALIFGVITTEVTL